MMMWTFLSKNINGSHNLHNTFYYSVIPAYRLQQKDGMVGIPCIDIAVAIVYAYYPTYYGKCKFK